MKVLKFPVIVMLIPTLTMAIMLSISKIRIIVLFGNNFELLKAMAETANFSEN